MGPGSPAGTQRCGGRDRRYALSQKHGHLPGRRDLFRQQLSALYCRLRRRVLEGSGDSLPAPIRASLPRVRTWMPGRLCKITTREPGRFAKSMSFDNCLRDAEDLSAEERAIRQALVRMVQNITTN